MEEIFQKIIDLFIAFYPLFYYLALFIGIVFSISGFTDLPFDIAGIIWGIRRMILGKKIQPLTLDRLEAREQQRIAIFIAAWQEADVIAQTLENACDTINYKNYDIFVGTYPNDPDTQREVDRVSQERPWVHNVITPEPGPTNKASNLNHVFNAIISYESRTGEFFDIIVMHDSEDVIHPYSLLVYNYLIPRMEMIQIPVFPMALPLKKVTHWTYADEFAENHTKILRMREVTGGFVPSAGVGTAFTKRAFQIMALEEGNIFSPDTLTEDYQLGWRLNLMGMEAAFVTIKLPAPKNNQKKGRNISDWVATRAIFPMDFRHAVKQKTRWNIGIILQGWESMGWKGSLAMKWNLFQDRKALITTPVNFLAYFVFLYALGYQLLNFLSRQMLPVLIPAGSFLGTLVLISTVFMIWRTLNRALAVHKIYGFLPALTSIPRTVWGNAINFYAITRAVFQFFINKLKKRTVAWDKTAHEFPTRVTANKESTLQVARKEKDSMFNLSIELPHENIVRMFDQRMRLASEEEQIKQLLSIPKKYGELLFPIMVRYLYYPSWKLRAAVCRSLSYLQIPDSIPHLKRAACDPDWIVRSNAVRALGKLGQRGEQALLNLLHSKDLYAKDAARLVLEQQGFFDQHLAELDHSDYWVVERAERFFKILAHAGDSSLAKQILETHENTKIFKNTFLRTSSEINASAAKTSIHRE